MKRSGKPGKLVILKGILSEFGFEATDKELQDVETVQDLHTFIWQRLSHDTTSREGSQGIFAWAAAYLGANLDVPPGNISPATDPSSLLPKNKRKITWKSIQQMSPLILPDVEWSDRKFNIWWIPGIVICIPVIMLISFTGLEWEKASVIGVLLTEGSLYYLLCSYEFRERTMEEFALEILWLNRQKIKGQLGYSRHDMEQLVNWLIRHNAYKNSKSVQPAQELKEFGFY
ncbi:MAG: hypothetical protein V4649_04085 [Bacteroidota bacterium]